MVGELGDRVPARKRTPESFGVESPIYRGDGGFGRGGVRFLGLGWRKELG